MSESRIITNFWPFPFSDEEYERALEEMKKKYKGSDKPISEAEAKADIIRIRMDE